VLNNGVTKADEDVLREAAQKVRDEIGPVAAFRLCIVVPRLPKTRSGKVLRGTMRCIADGEPWTLPATIDDPETLDEVTTALQGLGFPRA
ncbi:MAG: propionyl-CoA synthetase, partial [Woeseiaceae bacterium]